MELRTLRDEDAEQAWQLDQDAFHTSPEGRDHYLRWFEPDRRLGIFDGSRLLAVTGAHPFGQFFGGRSVPMGGVTAVCVAPDQRGHGHASRLLRELLGQMHGRGEVFSSLFPATTALYRQLGWEVAGAHIVRRVTPAVLRTLPAPAGGRVRPAAPDDTDARRACYERLARETNGFVDLPDRFWRASRENVAGRSVFVAENDAGEITGYLIYRQFDGEFTHMGGGPFGIRVDDLIATDRDAALGLWGLLASWSSQVDQVIYRAAAEDPLILLLGEQEIEVVAEIRWMARAVDAAGAVAARGFAPAVEAQVDLELSDSELAANRGRFSLGVSKGRGRLEPGGSGSIALDIGAFSSLYTGWATTATLARAGRLTGGSAEERALLDAVFAGPTAWIPNEF